MCSSLTAGLRHTFSAAKWHICSRCKLGFCAICVSRSCQCSHKGRRS